VASPKRVKRADDAVYAVCKDVAYRELKGQTLFLLPGDRFLHTMNPAGEFIWSCVKRKQPLPRIVAAFAKHFSIEPETAAADVTDFLKRLAGMRVITKLARK